MDSHRQYKYVGSANIKAGVPDNPERYIIQSVDDVLEWIAATKQQLEDNQVVATFIIDTDGNLYINDRRSEHVRCAAGGDVLSAGEITFSIHKKHIEITEITNQSTGYCPEPESWHAVDATLSKLKIPYPTDFTSKLTSVYAISAVQRISLKMTGFIVGFAMLPLASIGILNSLVRTFMS